MRFEHLIDSAAGKELTIEGLEQKAHLINVQITIVQEAGGLQAEPVVVHQRQVVLVPRLPAILAEGERPRVDKVGRTRKEIADRKEVDADLVLNGEEEKESRMLDPMGEHIDRIPMQSMSLLGQETCHAF